MCETVMLMLWMGSDFEFWNFTYGMPEGSSEIPYVKLEFETV
jgi:hypothetical protein